MVLVVALALLGLPYILVSCGGFPAKIREGAEANEEFSVLFAPPPPVETTKFMCYTRTCTHSTLEESQHKHLM